MIAMMIGMTMGSAIMMRAMYMGQILGIRTRMMVAFGMESRLIPILILLMQAMMPAIRIRAANFWSNLILEFISSMTRAIYVLVHPASLMALKLCRVI